MKKRLAFLLMGGGLMAVLAVAAACGTDLEPVEERVGALEATAGKIDVRAGEKNFQVTGVEWKGSTTAKDLAPPSLNPADLSGGYGFKGPGEYDAANPDKWQVASYVWVPGSMAAYQGDRVTLNFFIINGNEHEVWIEGPDGSVVVQKTEMNRGREYQFSFTASQPGVYTLVCNTHAPTMTAPILVLPRA